MSWTVVDAVGIAVARADAFLRYRFDCGASPNTLRAYAHDLKLFSGFLAERSLAGGSLAAGSRSPPAAKPRHELTTTADIYSHLQLEDLRAELDAAGLLGPVADVVG